MYISELALGAFQVKLLYSDERSAALRGRHGGHAEVTGAGFVRRFVVHHRWPTTGEHESTSRIYFEADEGVKGVTWSIHPLISRKTKEVRAASPNPKATQRLMRLLKW